MDHLLLRFRCVILLMTGRYVGSHGVANWPKAVTQNNVRDGKTDAAVLSLVHTPHSVRDP